MSETKEPYDTAAGRAAQPGRGAEGEDDTPQRFGGNGAGVGMPAYLWLNSFGSIIWDVFGEPPYLVGSATRGKNWRDVDVRLILDDAEYERWCGPWRAEEALNDRWVGLCLAFAALGRQMTGLPIDFQIQQMTHANRTYPHQDRNALGLVGHRLIRDFGDRRASDGEGGATAAPSGGHGTPARSPYCGSGPSNTGRGRSR